MIVPYTLLKNIIWIEISLVILIIIITYSLKFLFYLNERHKKRLSEQIEFYLSTFLLTKQSFSEKDFLKQWKRLDLVLPIIYKIDQTNHDESWNAVRDAVVRNVLLPIARKKYDSYRWMNRLLSVQCFEIAMDDHDEEMVCNLLMDKIPLIHMHAVIAAVRHSTITMINIVISSMAEKRRLGQTVYLKVFEQAAPHTRDFIESRLNMETNPYTRATCFKILLEFPMSQSELSIDTSADINSPNIELRLAAIRFTAYAHRENAIPLLIELLSNESWETRATCARLLGDLNSKSVIPELTKCMKDPVWWVRVNAANSLKNLGDEGLNVLHTQDPNVDLYAYETAMHVLNKPSIHK